MGVVEHRHRARLALEAAVEFTLGDLDRDSTVEPGVASLPHDAHSALA